MANSVVNSLAMDLDPWHAINDNVMGGVSSGEMIQTRDGLRFQGNLSLENNGGFASVRRQINNRLDGHRAVRLCFRGDGRNYQFRVRLDDQFDGMAWRALFETNESEQIIVLEYEDFESVIRGRVLADVPPLKPADIRQIGFLVADSTPGPFRLDIIRIEFLAE